MRWIAGSKKEEEREEDVMPRWDAYFGQRMPLSCFFYAWVVFLLYRFSLRVSSWQACVAFLLLHFLLVIYLNGHFSLLC